MFKMEADGGGGKTAGGVRGGAEGISGSEKPFWVAVKKFETVENRMGWRRRRRWRWMWWWWWMFL